MKKSLLFLSALLCSAAMSAATWNVTVPDGTKACYIAGEATGWSHTEMTKVDATHYTITIETDKTDKYKYCSGPEWAYEELTAEGGKVEDRMYAEQDVVAKWKTVYEPGATVSYVDIDIRVKADAAPTIWWWGAGDKCPNAQDVPGMGYDWATNQPIMTAVEGQTGWFEWNFKDVNASLGVTFKLNSGDKEINAKESTCYNVAGDAIACAGGGDDPQPGEATYRLVVSPKEWNPTETPMNVENGVAACMVTLDAAELQLAVVETNGGGETWLKNTTSPITRENNTVVIGKDASMDNTSFSADVAGNYTFNYTIATGTLVVIFPNEAQGINNISQKADFTKVIRNGQVLIIRDGVAYDMMGQEVK